MFRAIEEETLIEAIPSVKFLEKWKLPNFGRKLFRNYNEDEKP